MKPHLVHIFPAFATGGPEVRTALLLNASRDHFRHTVYALNGDLSGCCRVQPHEALAFHAAPDSSPRGLARLLRSISPDLLLTYGWGGTNGLMAARLAGWRHVVHTEDGFLPDEARGQILRRLWARRLLFRIARRVVVPSLTLEDLARRDWWLSKSKVRYLPNGVDVQRFVPVDAEQRAAIRARWNLPSDAFVVGTVGHLRSEKNQARLIRAFVSLAHRRAARLIIVGDGPARSELFQQVQSLGLEGLVLFPGAVQNPVEFLQAMDLFALSSDTEQMPIAVLEAMAVGLPVVSTDVGDTKFMVCDANRPWISDGIDDQAFSIALASLADAPEKCATLGEQNRRLCVEKYDLTRMVENYIQLYTEMLNGATHA